MTTDKKRCAWVNLNSPLYIEYHDKEWGVPDHDDQHLFEMLILEGAQAGLNWETILKKREGYRTHFLNFDPIKVANMSDADLDEILLNPAVIRNKLKVYSARKNAKAFLNIQKEFGSFSTYIWSFVNHNPIQNHWSSHEEIPTVTKESEALSKDLKKRGMTFVGPTIMYAYMQACGLVNDHTIDCFCYKHNSKD